MSGIYNGKNDTLHCDVKATEFSKAQPILNGANWALFSRYLIERYKAKAPGGTTDPIIKKYRFPNVFRDEDAITQDVIRIIVNTENLDYNSQILNLILFRMWNNTDTFSNLGGPWYCYQLFEDLDQELQHAEHLYITRNKEAQRHLQWWNPKGYTQCGLRLRYDKAPWKLLGIAKHIQKQDTIKRIRYAENQKQAYDILCELPYFGPTLAYQVYLDLTYIPVFQFSDWEFAVADCDTVRGLKYLFIVSDMRPDAAMYYVKNNLDKIIPIAQTRFFERAEYVNWDPNEIFKDRGENLKRLPIGMICHNLKGFGKYMDAHEKGHFNRLYKHM